MEMLWDEKAYSEEKTTGKVLVFKNSYLILQLSV